MKGQPKQKWSWLINFHHQFFCAISLLLVFSFFNCLVIQGQQVHCQLKKVSDSVYAGRCLCRDSLIFTINLKPFPAKGTGFWKGGSSLQGPRPNDPIFLKVRDNEGTIGTHYQSPDGILTTWYHITGFKINDGQLEFFFDMMQISKPSSNDIAILQRVKTYLSDSLKWSRYDNRYFAYIDCKSGSKKKTLFCALYAAQTDILGDFYGGPTFWALGNAINRYGEFQHPLQGFNNDLKISFSTLHAVIDDAIMSMKSSIPTNDK